MIIALTGASSGIGKQTSHHLKLFGYSVLDITRDKLNLDDLDAVSKFDLEGVDVLINNAGHELGLGKRFSEIDNENWLSQLNVNLLAPMLLTHNFLNQNTSGTVINITSGIVDDYRTNSVPYFVSKSGLSLFTKSMRSDYKDSFRFVDIRPKRVDTYFSFNNGSSKNNSDDMIDPIEVAKSIKLAIENEMIQNITVSHPKRG